MSYARYVAMAYAVFALVMLWDFVVPRLQLRRQLLEARRRAARSAAPSPPADTELSR